MRGTKSAVRYAKALIELAIENNLVDQVNADMKQIIVANNETKDFQLFLDSPIVGSEKKLSILNELFPNHQKLTTSFIELIVNNKREKALAQIADSYITLVKEKQGIVSVTLTSAQALDASTKKSILDKLAVSIKGTLEIEEKIDSSLIGGFIIKMGDKQIDASISNKIKNLKTSLTR
jgi:F-type H+-transporting ATPase subunit delta